MPVAATSSSSPLPTTPIGLEDKGPEVVKVERALARLGYMKRDKYSRDGYFGTNARDAVKRFQRARKLPITGRYDKATREALAAALANPANKAENILKLDSKGDRVRRLESRLERLGMMNPDKYSRDGNFGTLTRDALKNIQSDRGLAVTGTFNSATRAAVRQMLAEQRTLGAEPAHNYSRVSFRGATVNARTRTMLLRAEQTLKKMGLNWTFNLVQGSYSTSVAASGNTHAGGGAVDISVRGPSGAYRPYEQTRMAVKALRMAGFAAWSRGYSDGTSFSPHIHGIAIGDRQLSSAARSQVASYFNGRNGLVNNGTDRDASIGRPIPAWANKYR